VRGWEKWTPLERFVSKIDQDDGSGCWLWTAGISPAGYAQFRYDGKKQNAHRFSYEVFNGPIPEGTHIDHLCRVRHCVNPAHLEAVTCHENIMRGEGVAAINSKKTHCPKGHELTGANLRAKNNERRCLACHRDYHREWMRRKHGFKRRYNVRVS
jgi:hypothetical protein